MAHYPRPGPSVFAGAVPQGCIICSEHGDSGRVSAGRHGAVGYIPDTLYRSTHNQRRFGIFCQFAHRSNSANKIIYMFVPVATLAAINGGRTVYVTNATTLKVHVNGTCRQTVTLRRPALVGLTSPDEFYLAVMMDNSRTAIHYVNPDGTLEAPYYLEAPYVLLNLVAISNRYLYLASHATWQVYDLETGQLVNQPLAHDDLVYSACLTTNSPQYHAKETAMLGPNFVAATWINMSNVQRTADYLYVRNMQGLWVAVRTSTQRAVYTFPPGITALRAFDTIVLTITKHAPRAYHPGCWGSVGEVAWALLYDVLPADLLFIVRSFVPW